MHTQMAVVQSSNQTMIADVDEDLILSAAFYILFNISADDLQIGNGRVVDILGSIKSK